MLTKVGIKKVLEDKLDSVQMIKVENLITIAMNKAYEDGFKDCSKIFKLNIKSK